MGHESLTNVEIGLLARTAREMDAPVRDELIIVS